MKRSEIKHEMRYVEIKINEKEAERLLVDLRLIDIYKEPTTETKYLIQYCKDLTNNDSIELKGFKDYNFNGLDCMISLDQQTLGFFKDDNDRRPSQASYFNKKQCETLFNIFKGCKK